MTKLNQILISTSMTSVICLIFVITGSGAVADQPIAKVPASPKTTSFTEKLWQDRPLASLKATLERTEGKLPQNLAASRMADADLILHSTDECRPWIVTACQWDAPDTCHLPLLFEEPNLERMGYGESGFVGVFDGDDCPWTPGCLQPLLSGAHFFGSLAVVPYQCGYQPACEPVSTLGVDRPGSPVCYRRHLVPLSLQGAVYQAGFVTGLVFFIP